MTSFFARTSKQKSRKSPFASKTAIKRTFAAAISILFVSTAVYADVLGTHISATGERIAPYTDYYENVFEDETVGRQTEHYIEYAPNGIVLPTVTNGMSAYGKRTVLQAANVLKDQGLNPAAGINADFFSFQTGVPMSNTLINGRIFTADSSWMPGIGFRKNGTAFCSTFPIYTTLKTQTNGSFQIECINKYRQPYSLYLYNGDFGNQTYTQGMGVNAVLSNVSGDLKIGGEITATVESVSESNGALAIPDGKMILSVDSSAADELKDRLSKLTVGETVTISTTVSENLDLWTTAENAIGALGGKLITNGRLDYEDESAAPRTAVGIKADGNIIFYTIDGRQKGYSYGARKETVARRLLELGCVEAISLDGGGSTSMAISSVENSDFHLVNSPSDSGLRSCANFLFLTKPYSNKIPYVLAMNNNGAYVLSGTTISVAAEHAYDTSYTKTDLPGDITYYMEYNNNTPDGSGQNSYVDNNGNLTVYGNGQVFVGSKSGDVYGEATVTSVTTPDTIVVYDNDYGYEIKELAISPGTKVNLLATSTYGSRQLLSSNNCYKFTLASKGESIGTITNDGTFTAGQTSGATGTLAVSAGICSVEIPVVITGDTGNAQHEYPAINANISGSTLSISLDYSKNLSKDSIVLSIDGKQTDFDLKGNKITYQTDGRYHRIALCVTTPDNLSAFKVFDMGNISSVENAFSDTSSHWARNYISYLAQNNTVNGSLEDGGKILFNPDNHMKRVEFAIMLCNYLEINTDNYRDVILPFIDNDQIPWWAENKVKAVYSLGLMKGQLGQYGTSFNPNADINRMEFAISLSRLMPTGLYSAPIFATDSDSVPFWAEESMKTAVTQGVLSGYPDGSLRPTQSVTRAEGVKMLYNIYGIK